MTNDTNTLNGALRELGETMAANLTTQGVASTYDEGLTTLASKILDIVPGPGPTPTVASVGLSADKSILSFADSESATLSATVLDSNDDPMEGVTVTFYNGSTSMGTADTNSSGVATKSYASTGVGDLSFTASVGTISSETFVVQDCEFYDALTENHNKWTVSGSMSDNTHNSNGWKYGNASSLVWIDNNFVLSDGVSIEFTPTELNGGSNNNPSFMLYFENASQTRVYFTQSSSFIQMNSSTKTTYSTSLGSEYRVEYTSNTLKLYLGDTLVGSASHSLGTSNIKVRLATGSGRYCRIKDFKIKPL